MYKDCHFGQFGTINARYNSQYQRVSGDLIRLRNCSKLVEGSLFAIIDLLLAMKFVLMYIIGRVGDGFLKKYQPRKHTFSITYNLFLSTQLHKHQKAVGKIGALPLYQQSY